MSMTYVFNPETKEIVSGDDDKDIFWVSFKLIELEYPGWEIYWFSAVLQIWRKGTNIDTEKSAELPKELKLYITLTE